MVDGLTITCISIKLPLNLPSDQNGTYALMSRMRSVQCDHGVGLKSQSEKLKSAERGFYINHLLRLEKRFGVELSYGVLQGFDACLPNFLC